ncbi:MAG: T9SS type A sorting domain-containing protein [Bacteroidota bacterium]
MKKYSFLILFLLLINSSVYSQLDTVKGGWPFPPFNQSQPISATFAEFRNTLSSDHFHNAADVPEPDGNPCFPSLDGTVYSLTPDGSNAYIRIATKVGSKWKHLTYLHIRPNPSLSLGDSVKQGVTRIGTVVSGMGHVHLIERELGNNINDNMVEINNLRKNGGLTPYIDTWAPVIHESSLKFYVNATSERLQHDQLYGKVDVQIKIEEINGSTSIERNNGTYIAGYRVWDEAMSQIVYEPDDAGIKYRFDCKPSNSYVHNTFVKNVATLSNPVYWLTNGDGADYINDTKVVGDNYFDASSLPSGNYQLEIFSEDTRDNKTNKFFPITIVDPKPTIPQVYTLVNTDGKSGLKIQWKKNSESDIVGYRLYYSANSELTDWQLAADESQLTNEINEYTISSPSEFVVPPVSQVYFFAFTAIDKIGQESDMSDVFVRSDLSDGIDLTTALIVNAFPKMNEEDDRESHNYTASYFAALSTTDSMIISSASNKAFLDNINDITFLQNYDLVVWYTGDNTNHVSTIQVKEMLNLAQYLEGGGNLFMSGSKIGYDLDFKKTNLPADTLFYHHYLKAKYVYVGDDFMKPVVGVNNTLFSDVTLNYGQVSEEKYPDDIDPIYGSEVLLNYNQVRSDSSTYRHAGIGFKGKFRDSDIEGAMVYTSFPLETVGLLTEQQVFFKSLLEYFDMITDVEKEFDQLPNEFRLSQNYPNPFNPSTTIQYSIPSTKSPLHRKGFRGGLVTLKVYDVLGREVKTLINKEQKPGTYQIVFDAQNLSSGIYFARLTVDDPVNGKQQSFNKTISMLLLK